MALINQSQSDAKFVTEEEEKGRRRNCFSINMDAKYKIQIHMNYARTIGALYMAILLRADKPYQLQSIIPSER